MYVHLNETGLMKIWMWDSEIISHQMFQHFAVIIILAKYNCFGKLFITWLMELVTNSILKFQMVSLIMLNSSGWRD